MQPKPLETASLALIPEDLGSGAVGFDIVRGTLAAHGATMGRIWLSGLSPDGTPTPGPATLDYETSPELEGSGLMPEAIREVERLAFESIGLTELLISPRRLGHETLTRTQWEVAEAADPDRSSYIASQQAEALRIIEHQPRVAYVRSGGQTGADRAALDAARSHGVPICGWCPPGGLAEDRPTAPGLLEDYPELREGASQGYVERTAWNVRDSHATLVVAPAGLQPRSGTEMTVRFAASLRRPCLVISGPEELGRAAAWLAGLPGAITLNVAGPRESKTPGTYRATFSVVSALLDEG